MTYSVDLRKKVVAFVHDGGSQAEAARRFDVSLVEMYARGLSMRDIKAAFTGADGRCVLTKSAASQVAERLWEDYVAFAGAPGSTARAGVGGVGRHVMHYQRYNSAINSEYKHLI